ncbi:MAG: hypothetical protein ACOYMB_01340 [Patescibacteria group bacterium]
MKQYEEAADGLQKKLDFPEHPRKIDWETYLDDLEEKIREEDAIYATTHREEWDKQEALQKVRDEISEVKETTGVSVELDENGRHINDETAFHKQAKEIKEKTKTKEKLSKLSRNKAWWRSMAK